MQNNDAKYYPARKSPRANFHNYSGGEYFVTICTDEKEHFFGTIADNQMHFSPVGKYCREQLESLSNHYKYVSVPLFVVMPNHVHAIIQINPVRYKNNHGEEADMPSQQTLLAVVIAGFKRSVTLFARRNDHTFGWQQRYHDHIIRGNKDRVKIAEYINNNVSQWYADCYNK